MKVLELRGLPSYHCMQAVHKFVLGLKMLPMYGHEEYHKFLDRLDQMPACDQETMIREAVLFVRPESEEFFDIVQFAADSNGIPYSKQNVGNLEPNEIHEIITAVSMEVIRAHKVRLVSESEKKN